MIVDPGAWTNLMGADLIRTLIQRAQKNGHNPIQRKMPVMDIAGVGEGAQKCEWSVELPIASTHGDGQAHLHKISMPIVEGKSGDQLPGLLGLKSLEAERAIMDTGGQMLYFPGPGKVEISLPPGSIAIPLHKAPSGHQCIVVDDYEKVIRHTGGVSPASLELHARLETSGLDLARQRASSYIIRQKESVAGASANPQAEQ